jgi:hypothetical protein
VEKSSTSNKISKILFCFFIFLFLFVAGEYYFYLNLKYKNKGQIIKGGENQLLEKELTSTEFPIQKEDKKEVFFIGNYDKNFYPWGLSIDDSEKLVKKVSLYGNKFGGAQKG